MVITSRQLDVDLGRHGPLHQIQGPPQDPWMEHTFKHNRWISAGGRLFKDKLFSFSTHLSCPFSHPAFQFLTAWPVELNGGQDPPSAWLQPPLRKALRLKASQNMNRLVLSCLRSQTTKLEVKHMWSTNCLKLKDCRPRRGKRM